MTHPCPRSGSESAPDTEAVLDLGDDLDALESRGVPVGDRTMTADDGRGRLWR